MQLKKIIKSITILFCATTITIIGLTSNDLNINEGMATNVIIALFFIAVLLVTTDD